jgi:hypothetical protein
MKRHYETSNLSKKQPGTPLKLEQITVFRLQKKGVFRHDKKGIETERIGHP